MVCNLLHINREVFFFFYLSLESIKKFFFVRKNGYKQLYYVIYAVDGTNLACILGDCINAQYAL